ncbi:TPA: sugar phosphate isomerase/epimerase [Candidatus Poribacteria bacterium]|nr:sugar phosphate isomerase/epimerase [Candidatus Poribacteria bacterium]
MKPGILIGDFMKTMSLEEGVELSSDIGYPCVELPASDMNGEGKQYSKDSSLELVDWANSLGLEITGFQCHVGYSSPDWERRVEHTKKMVDIAEHAGIPVVHTVSGILPSEAEEQQKHWLKGTKEIAKTEEWGNLLNAYREILEHAESKAVKVGIEPVFVYMVCNFETTKKLFDDLGRDDLYINFDPSHFPYQRESVIPFIEEFGEKIVHTHVKDATVSELVDEEIEKGEAFSMERGEQFKFAPPGKGVLNWREILKALKGVGYDYVLSLEMGHGYEDPPEEIARENLQFVNSLLKEFS